MLGTQSVSNSTACDMLQAFSEKYFKEMASACVLHIGINLGVRK